MQGHYGDADPIINKESKLIINGENIHVQQEAWKRNHK